jgi:hypothetical protein
VEATREGSGTTNLPEDTGTNNAAPITEQAATAVLQTTSKAQASAGKLADQARQQIVKQLNNQKDRATSSLESMVNVLRQSGQQLEEQGQAPVAGLANKAADGIEQVWLYLSDRDVVALEREGEQFARTRPALFLAGAFALGFLGARFFKSGRPSQQNGQNYPVPQSGANYAMPAAATPGYYAGSPQSTTYAGSQGTAPYERPATASVNTAATW